MKSKWNINKKGSYIVEATIFLPFYLISLIVLTTIILMYSTAENVVFTVCDEMRLAAIEARTVQLNPILPVKLKERIIKENSNINNLKIEKYSYHECYKDISAIIDLELKLRYKNPLDYLADDCEFQLKVMTRSYVGNTREIKPSSIEYFTNKDSEVVYVFPNYGECYHNDNCYLVKESYRPVLLSRYILNNYESCNMCGSSKANLGELVYIFPKTGGSYHLCDCNLIDRVFLKMDKQIAIDRGYTPCSKCGG